MVFDKHGLKKNSIRKSNDTSISIPLKFQEFQDCIDFHMSTNYISNNRIETVKTAVGCHSMQMNETNPTSLSLQNITLSESNTKLCSLIYREDKIRYHGGIFNVTLAPIQQPCKSSSCFLNAVYTNTMLALTCRACFNWPCFITSENSTVTFVIPFILTNKTYFIEPFHPNNAPNLCIILLAASLSCLVFLVFVTTIYRCIHRKRSTLEK